MFLPAALAPLAFSPPRGSTKNARASAHSDRGKRSGSSKRVGGHEGLYAVSHVEVVDEQHGAELALEESQ